MKALVEINSRFGGRLIWAVFGGVGVAVHYGRLYRQHKDIDLIVEDREDYLGRLLHREDFTIHWRSGRKRGRMLLDGQVVEFLFLTGRNEIDAPGSSKFRFREIQLREIYGLILPVIDLPALRRSKVRQLTAAKRDFLRRPTSATWKEMVHTVKDRQVIECMTARSRDRLGHGCANREGLAGVNDDGRV